MTGRLRGALVAGAALAAIAVAGCGTGGSSGSGSAPVAGSSASSGSSSPVSSQNVTIEGTNSLKFSPMAVRVKAGTVRITLKDMGAYPHNIVIPSLKVTSKTVTGDPGGATIIFTVKFPHPGKYTFYCQYHQSAGMTGVFMVS